MGEAIFPHFPPPVFVSAKWQPAASRTSTSTARSLTRGQHSRTYPARSPLHSSTSPLLPGAAMTPLLPGVDMIPLLPGADMTPLSPGADVTLPWPCADMTRLLPDADMTPLLPGADITPLLSGTDLAPLLPGAGISPGPLPESTLPSSLLKTPPKDWMVRGRNDSTSNSKESEIDFSPSGLFHNSITAAALTKQGDGPKRRPDTARNVPTELQFASRRSLGKAEQNSGRPRKKNCSKSDEMNCNEMHYKIDNIATRAMQNRVGKDTRNYSSKRIEIDTLSQLQDQSGLKLQKRAIQKRDKASTGEEGSSKTSEDTTLGLDGTSEQGSNPGNVNEESWNDYIDKLFDPEFDAEVQGNISAVVGQTVHMGCRVNNLGTKTVS